MVNEERILRERRTMRRGATILEVMIAMVVLAIALVGALAALQQGMIELRLGQNRQQKLMLADAALQRDRLLDKVTVTSATVPLGVHLTPLNARPMTLATDPRNTTTFPVGSWVTDPTEAVGMADPNDLSVGAYFNILPDGTITRIAVPGNPSCGAVALPAGTICREVWRHNGLPYLASAIGVPNSNVVTTYVRIARKPSGSAPAEPDIVLSQVIVQ